MKRLLFLCALLFIGLCANSNAENLDSLNQFTGWDYSGDIRTQKLKTAGYIYSQLMENGNELFTADSAGYIRIWNLETGKLRYSKKIGCERVFANYKNDIVYYHSQDTLYGYNIKADSFLFKFKDQYLSIFDPDYSFHNSNKILIPEGKSRQVYDRTNSIDYTEYWIKTKVFDCDSASFTSSSKIPYGDGYNFIYSKRNPNLYIYTNHTFKVDYYESKLIDSENKYYTFAKNPTNTFSNMVLGKQYNNAFSASEQYAISVYDSSLEFCDLTNTVDQQYDSCILDFKVYKFVVDKKDRIITTNADGTELVIGCWAASVSAVNIALPESLGFTNLALNSDSTAVIAAGVTGNLLFVPLNVSSQIKAGLTANRTNINVGEQVDFTSTCTGLVTDFKVLISDGGEITDYGMKYIFKKAGDFDVTIIAGDGVNYDKVVYKNMIHVADKVQPLLANYTEDRRFGYAPLTVNFKNTTNKPYTSIKWNFDDGTSSNEENPTHTFDQNGKYVVTLTIVSDGKTLTLSKDFNVIKEQFQDGRSGAGDFYSDNIATTWTTSSGYRNLVVADDDKFFYTEYESTCMNGSSQYSYSSKSSLKFCNGWDINLEINDPGFTYRRYLHDGIVTNSGFVYNSSGKVLFEASKTTPGTIIPDSRRDSLISYDKNKLYYCDEYFEPIWNKDFYELTNDSCNVLGVHSMYNGNISLFLYLKQAATAKRFEIDVPSGQVIESNIINCDSNATIYHLNDNLYLSHDSTYLQNFDKAGNILKKENIGRAFVYKLDSNLIMTFYSKEFRTEFKFFNADLQNIYTNCDSTSHDWYYIDMSPILLKDKSIIFMENVDHYNGFNAFSMLRYFFPEIYNKNTSSIDSTKKGIIKPVSYPLPAVDEVRIGLDSIGTAESIEVMDLNGNLCNAAIKSSDSNTLILDISKLSPGTYFYSINSNGKQFKGKFIKQK